MSCILKLQDTPMLHSKWVFSHICRHFLQIFLYYPSLNVTIYLWYKDRMSGEIFHLLYEYPATIQNIPNCNIYTIIKHIYVTHVLKNMTLPKTNLD